MKPVPRALKQRNNAARTYDLAESRFNHNRKKFRETDEGRLLRKKLAQADRKLKQ